MDKKQTDAKVENKKAEKEPKIPTVCASYDKERYTEDSEYKKKTDEEATEILGFIDDNLKSNNPFDKVFQRTPDVKDLSKLLNPVSEDGIDLHSKLNRDFSIILNETVKLGHINKQVNTKPKLSGLGSETIDKFQNDLEEVYVKIELNDCKIRVLLAQYELIDTYFFSLISKMDEKANSSAVHTASSHDIKTVKFLESIGMKDYTPLGNTFPSIENTKVLFETLDEIKSDNKLYRDILKANGRKYE